MGHTTKTECFVLSLCLWVAAYDKIALLYYYFLNHLLCFSRLICLVVDHAQTVLT
eukprot:m.208248 g.208248  ORF g.208248 m.208248 type:complete len:55 (-) comp16924_c1_seq1:362-526(-)